MPSERITTTSLRQAIAPVDMLGRVSSLLIMSTFGARPIGAGLAAIVAAQYGLPACLALAVGFFAAQLICILCSALPLVRSLHDAGARPAS
ncbi:MFS transporter [Microbacterium lushaniae]|uniref:MFS transporter n=1 Tax=Microbacterium lushaniae TaxID=2614639 RepID=A0A5J6L6H0_9MICO|nr:MFS transporter [Microbacterium lushaniae]QEW04269.1 MFS transporter [Microbacterium lushaniae]